MTAWTPSILVALRVGEARSVTPATAADLRGVETVSDVPVSVGDELDVQVRCSAGARRLLLDVRARVETRALSDERKWKIRLTWLSPEEPGLAVLVGVARDMGLVAESPSQVPLQGDALPARVGERRPTFTVPLGEGERRAADLEALSTGSLMLATEAELPTNSAVLVRVALPEGRHLWLSARVVFRGEVSPGQLGVGLALEGMPEVVRRELRALRSN